jgi:hypothetical protein
MDQYSWERWILERHEAVVNEAERRAQLMPEVAAEPGALSTSIAWLLRDLADRLDGQGRQERLRSNA